MSGRRIHVYSDYVPNRVNSKYYGFGGTGDIYRSLSRNTWGPAL
jgi:hypothetical protein